MSWLPAVGMVVGALAGLGAWALDRAGSHPLAVAAAFGLSIALTGALHIDGLLDSADALGASVPPERRREIMKDPRHGTFAVASFAIVAVVWLAALWSIVPARMPVVLAFAGATARWSVVWIAWFVPYGAGGASATTFEQRPSPRVHALMGVTIVAIGGTVGWISLVLVPLAVVLAICLARAARPMLGGGLTGDVYGAILVVLDVLVLAALSFLR